MASDKLTAYKKAVARSYELDRAISRVPGAMLFLGLNHPGPVKTNAYKLFVYWHKKIFPPGESQQSFRRLWHNDPFHRRWKILAEAYNQVGTKTPYALNPYSFLLNAAEIMRVPLPENYFDSMGWAFDIVERQIALLDCDQDSVQAISSQDNSTVPVSWKHLLYMCYVGNHLGDRGRRILRRVGILKPPNRKVHDIPYYPIDETQIPTF
uniref:Putative mating type 1-2-7 protein n=1 Tax=Knoxdaviesia capensis TaxID=114771 RepID=A0A1J0CYG1_9PEZI|nr:putative mating type 1-2-7 protein [Knoxdaviesia capensis]